MSDYFYRGRHRAPTHTGRNVAALATTGALALAPLVLAQGAASADDLDVIAQCESGGRNVKNSSSSASGYFQIINGTWAGNGGLAFAPTAMQATKAEQRIVAERIAQRRGSYADWNPSRSCWGGKVGSGVAPSTSSSAGSGKARTQAPKTRTAPRDSGRGADGSGSYTCDTAHLHFAACDTDNLGATVAYPRYDRATRSVVLAAVETPTAGRHHLVERGDTLTKIAAANGTTWRDLAAKNRGTVTDPNLIFPGQQLAT